MQTFLDTIPTAKKKMIAAGSRSVGQSRPISRRFLSDQIPATTPSCRWLRRLRLSLQPGRESNAAKLIEIACWPHARSKSYDVHVDGNP